MLLGNTWVSKRCTLCPQQESSGRGRGRNLQTHPQGDKNQLLSVLFTVLQPVWPEANGN